MCVCVFVYSVCLHMHVLACMHPKWCKNIYNITVYINVLREALINLF